LFCSVALGLDKPKNSQFLLNQCSLSSFPLKNLVGQIKSTDVAWQFVEYLSMEWATEFRFAKKKWRPYLNDRRPVQILHMAPEQKFGQKIN
jgi:hypothetical protein